LPRLLILILILTPLYVSSQTITGKLYDDKTTAKNVTIINIQKNTQSYSDNNGNFKTSASVGDSLVFKSLFYNEKILVVTQDHFNHTIVVQLKKIVNKLDEVLLSEKQKFKVFDENEHQENVNTQLKNDKKNSYYLYNNYRSGGVDFIAIANLIGKLFKNKNAPDPIYYVDYKELDVFFKNHDYFNEKLLVNELKISEAYRYLFFDYCEGRLISKKQLNGNQLELLDLLMTYSNEFHKILEAEIKD